MTADQAKLWGKIETFQFDPDGARCTFADRLAKENGWSAAFARRAIEEYRRFTFLAAAAGHAVSPSEVVDQVWHTHLLFTRSYWQDFCPNVLGKALHHEPSSGLEGESRRFDNWYGLTLASYRRHFGEPPADIWPDGTARLAETHQYRRVDLADHWVLPRRKGLKIAQAIAAALLVIGMLLVAAECRADDAAVLYNPLEFRGPKFLAFFALAYVAAIILAVLIRRAGSESPELAGHVASPQLDAYGMAYLAGGRSRVAATAAAALYQRGLLMLNSSGFKRVSGGAPPSVRLHRVEQALLDAVQTAGRATLRTLTRQTADVLEQTGEPLKQSGWVISDERANFTRMAAMLVMLAVPALGVVKIFVGLARNRPVGFLTIFCVVGALLAIVVNLRRPLRTRKGDAALASLRRQTPREGLEESSSADLLAVMVALDGIAALSGTPWQKLRIALQPPVTTSGWDGGSGCGGGSSSGCGGGGCGGGGCGGCGS